MKTDELDAVVRAAWAVVPAPPQDDLKLLAWACGTASWRILAGVRPVDVDISSPAFLGCTPLMDLPPRAAAAYLGSYLLSFVDGIAFQENSVVFYDIVTRSHVLFCLGDTDFWAQVIRPELPDECIAAIADVCRYIADHRAELAVDGPAAQRILDLADGSA